MKTNAERQAEYRKRRKTTGEGGERQIKHWVSNEAFMALERVAQHHAITKKELLERLILSAEEAIDAPPSDQEKTVQPLEPEATKPEKPAVETIIEAPEKISALAKKHWNTFKEEFPKGVEVLRRTFDSACSRTKDLIKNINKSK